MKAVNNWDLLIDFKVAFSLKSLSKIIFNVIYLASESCCNHDHAYARGYKMFNQQLMEKHLSTVFEIYKSVLHKKLDVHWHSCPQM